MKLNHPGDLPPLGTRLLEGRRAVITGGAGGIGRVTARLFADQGARVAVFDISDATRDFAASLGAGHRGEIVDVKDSDASKAAVESTLADFGGIDALVTMAGLVHPGGVGDLSEADFDDMIAMHLKGTFNACRAVAPSMRAAGRGSIVCMSSIAGERGGGLRGGAHYAAAKAGILGLARAMARDFAADGVRVNAVCPGPSTRASARGRT